jgi:hypothetical protein
MHADEQENVVEKRGGAYRKRREVSRSVWAEWLAAR